MPPDLSPRLSAILNALPLNPGLRVVEIGCGPGALARAMAERGATVVGVDRSAKAIGLAIKGSSDLIAEGRLSFRVSLAETVKLTAGEKPFDIAVAVRVGVLDGRHPESETKAKAAIGAMLRPGGQLFIDGGDPLRVILTA